MPSQRWRGAAGAARPAFDPLGTFKVPTVEPGREGTSALSAARRQRAATAADRSDRADLVVVGNGIAGCIAAMETRQYAPDARIVVVTEQNHPTINTPALKQFGAGRLELEQLLAYSPGTEQQHGIEVVHQRVTRLDPASHTALLADGRALSYHSLLLATGARATGLPTTLPGRDFDGVLKLHTLADYLDLRRRAPTASAAVVIGGGYHAAETAMMLRRQRLQVTWLIRGRSLLPRQLDPAASDLLLREVRRHGVEARLETEVVGIVGRMGVVAGVVTTANEFIPCELVIAAVGAQPDTALAEGTPITTQGGRGVRVNERLHTTARDVYAAGAVAATLDPQTGEYDARGQWYFAVRQGRLAAASIVGAPITQEAATVALGAFWHATQLDRMSVLVAGAPMLSEQDHPHNEVLTSGSGGAGGYYRRIVVRHGHLVGYLAVGAGQVGGMGVKRLIDDRIDIEAIKRKLLTEEFDPRTFLTQRSLHALRTGDAGAVPRSIEAQTENIAVQRRFQSA